MKIIDFHIDTLSRLLELEENSQETLYENKGHVDLERLFQANYAAQFFACFVNMGSPPINESHFNDVLSMIDIFNEGTKDLQDRIRLAKSYDDYLSYKESKTLSAFLTLEDGGVIGNDLGKLDILYEKGIRAITITWNYENSLGFPNHQYTFKDEGLKPFGIEVIERMDQLGIIIDVSHLSDGGFMDVLRYGKRPFLATHSNSRSICNVSRNLTDSMIKKLSDKGGMTGINFCGDFLQASGGSSIEAILRQIKHIINIGGLSIVGLGSDYDGISGELELKGAQDMPKLVRAMEMTGFTSNEIEAICYKNAEDFFKRYWA